MRTQFLISPVLRSGDQTVDTGHGGFDIRPRDLLEQGVSPLDDWQRIVFIGNDILAHSSLS